MTARTSRLLHKIVVWLAVLLTLPFYLTITGLSLMAFDSPDAGMKAWVFVSSVAGVSMLVPLLSLVYALRSLKHHKTLRGILIGFVPFFVLAGFWLWVSQQSFT